MAHKTKHGGEERSKTVVLYSPDMEFCISLAIFFQDRYNMITTTESESLFTIVNARRPQLVIIDDATHKPGVVPAERITERLDEIKRRNPKLRTILFRVSRTDDKCLEERLSRSADSIIYKPFDVDLVLRSIEELLDAQDVGERV